MKGIDKTQLYLALALVVIMGFVILTVKPLYGLQPQQQFQPAGLAVSATQAQAAPDISSDPLYAGYVIDSSFAPVATSTATSSFPQIDISLSPYVDVIESCGPYYGGGTCVNMRSGPGTEYPVLAKLRKGVVLKVGDVTENEGRQWYSVYVDDVLQHPERVISDWYVAADTVQLFYDGGDHYLAPRAGTTTQKHILVVLSKEMLYAYDGDTLYMQEPISTGLDKTPTPIGTFPVYKKTPSRYMQGPVEGVSDQYYDLPGVPWNLYFTKDGAVIHGAYWHDHFGEPWSHGCVNLPPDQAKKLYEWAPLGTMVTIQA